jgi:hypothetical protein
MVNQTLRFLRALQSWGSGGPPLCARSADGFFGSYAGLGASLVSPGVRACFGSYVLISWRGVDRIGYAHSASKATAETFSDCASEIP